MKRKPKPSKQRRPKLAGHIVELAKTDNHAAMVLAGRGRQFSDIESMLHLYYQALETSHQIMAGEKTKLEEVMENEPGWTPQHVALFREDTEKTLKDIRWQIGQIVMDAINSRDFNKIIEVGEAIEFLKSFKENPAQSGDVFRMRILLEKSLCESQGLKRTIRELATLIQWPMKDSENGFFGLRRMAKELGFPIKPATQIAPK